MVEHVQACRSLLIRSLVCFLWIKNCHTKFLNCDTKIIIVSTSLLRWASQTFRRLNKVAANEESDRCVQAIVPQWLLLVLDWVETLSVSTEGCVIDANRLDVLLKSSHDQSSDIKGALFKIIYFLNYMSNRVESLHVSSKGSVIYENWHNTAITFSRN